MPFARCFCGCGHRAVQKHHAIYAQEIKRVCLYEAESKDQGYARYLRLKNDERVLVDVAPNCHTSHHNRIDPFPLVALPDSVYEFATELLGPGRAFEYLRRRYGGDDPRLEALLTDYEEADHGRAA